MPQTPSLAALLDELGPRPGPDALYTAFETWAQQAGMPLYAHQADALLATLAGANTIITTPTGSGKSLIATAAHVATLAARGRVYYTAPIKALVSEKFFAWVDDFGADLVGMVTGDASVNPDAPIICCTAEILANIALREGASADLQMVVADEYHFIADPDRGWAWQVATSELPQAQFMIMSATLGDVTGLVELLTERTGRPTEVLAGATRPVPLVFKWSMTPLPETLTELVHTGAAPVYLVHPSQAAATEQAQGLMSMKLVDTQARHRIVEAIGGFRFARGFGATLAKMLRAGIGVHHAGLLPKYRRLVETLAQQGLLRVICGTDTLGVGINVPIRTVVFTTLSKFDGRRQRLLRAREFHQIAGRAGRPGFDPVGNVVVQAPEYQIENARVLAKFADDEKKLRSVRRKKPPEGFVNYTEASFDRLVAAQPDQVGFALIDSKSIDLFMPSVFPPIKADSIPELAEKLGLDPARVNATVAEFNAACRPGSFHPTELDGMATEGLAIAKTNWARPLDQPPYYGYQLRPGVTFTYLGLKVSDTAQVHSPEGPITNLWAAGEIMAGSILGQGYLAGFGMTIGTVFGRIAGKEAAAHVA